MADLRDDLPKFLLEFELDEEQVRARRRESNMGSLILHLILIILIILQPKLFPTGPLVTPAMEQLARMQRVFVYLPPEPPKLEKLPSPTPSESNRIAVKPTLKIDPEKLRQLATPPPGQPNQPPPGAQPAPPAAKPATPQSQVARLESPTSESQQTTGRLPLPLTSASRSIEESIKGSAQGGGAPGTGGGLAGGLPDMRHRNFSTSEPVILSDTRGVDFGPYLARVLAAVRRNWYAVIPESARLGQKGKVVLVFAILKDGSLPPTQPIVTRTSGQEPLDRAALSSIVASTPFPPLPAQFTGEQIVLQFTFLYNLPIEY